jgi:hypothetical protein
MGTSRIVPFVGEPVLLPGRPLDLFLVVYPDTREPAAPHLTLEFRRAGALVASSAPELPAADAQGRIPYIATVASEALTPGSYEVRAVLQQGRRMVAEKTSIRIGAP